MTAERAKASPAVELEGVTRRFQARSGAQKGEVVALSGLSLSVPAGGIYGLLGPNGAGKTTLLRLVSTILPPSEGRVSVLGIDALRHPDRVRRSVGLVLGGERSVYWRLTGRENLLYAASLHDLPGGVAGRRAEEVLGQVGLLERCDDLVERYSSGMRQRLALARAIVHDPPLLVLDEPTAGLDPHAAVEVRALLGAMAGGGRTVLMATHNMEEADRLCSAVAILDRGRLIAEGPTEVLKERSRTARSAGRGLTLEDAFLSLTGRSLAAADEVGALP